MKAGKTDDAKRHLQKEKRLDGNISSLLSMQLILETQVNTIQSTIMQRDMISALDLSNNVLKNIAVSTETADDVMDNARERLETTREVADILNQSIVPEVDVSAELEELLAADLIAPPPASVPVAAPPPAPVDDLVLPAVPQQALRVALPA
jgi:division protein CdvB (Snf7/Vps24/ESCRT-III family)